jgi:hypothetical protein
MAFELAVAGMRLESCPNYRHFSPKRTITLLSVVTFALDGSMPLVATTAKAFLSNICKKMRRFRK